MQAKQVGETDQEGIEKQTVNKKNKRDKWMKK